MYLRDRGSQGVLQCKFARFIRKPASTRLTDQAMHRDSDVADQRSVFIALHDHHTMRVMHNCDGDFWHHRRELRRFGRGDILSVPMDTVLSWAFRENAVYDNVIVARLT